MHVLQALLPNFEIKKQFAKYLEKADNHSRECWPFLLSPIKS